MFVYKVEYTIQESGENWKATILGENEKDVIEFLTRYIGKPLNINFIDQYFQVNGISDSIVKKIVDKIKRLEEAKSKVVDSGLTDEQQKQPEEPQMGADNMPQAQAQREQKRKDRNRQKEAQSIDSSEPTENTSEQPVN